MAGAGTMVMMESAGGAYEIQPLGAGGEATFERPRKEFRLWGGVPGIGLQKTAWFGEDDVLAGAIDIQVPPGGKMRIAGLARLVEASETGTERLAFSLIDDMGDNLWHVSARLGILSADQIETADEILVGPFPEGQYEFSWRLGGETARTTSVVIGPEPAFVDASP